MAKLTTDYPCHLNIRISAEMREALDDIGNASGFIRDAITTALGRTREQCWNDRLTYTINDGKLTGERIVDGKRIFYEEPIINDP